MSFVPVTEEKEADVLKFEKNAFAGQPTAMACPGVDAILAPRAKRDIGLPRRSLGGNGGSLSQLIARQDVAAGEKPDQLVQHP